MSKPKIKIGESVAFGNGWGPESRRYEGVVGIVEGFSKDDWSRNVSIRYPDDELFYPSEKNVYRLKGMNASASHHLDKEC